MKRLLTALLACLLLLSGCTLEVRPATTSSAPLSETSGFSLAEVPEYGSQPYTAVNGNEPYFTQTDYTTTAFEHYSELDAQGRCGVAYACVGQELMPTEKRGSIGQVRPSGWQTAKYDNVDGKYLYNRCHLIGYQLTGENANERNLITGTRYLNVQGMLPFENLVADYVKETANHVLYRVTPVFEGSELVARGVLMEGLSMEDDEIRFCVYVYNCQPGIEIDGFRGGNALCAEPQFPEVPPSGLRLRGYHPGGKPAGLHRNARGSDRAGLYALRKLQALTADKPEGGALAPPSGLLRGCFFCSRYDSPSRSSRKINPFPVENHRGSPRKK